MLGGPHLVTCCQMLLTSTPIRNGVAFLEPSNVTLKGYQTEDHDAHREEVFLSGLRKRLGRPDPPEARVQQQAQPQPAQAAPPIPAQPRAAPPRQPQPTRAPLPTDLDDMYEDDDIDPEMLDVLARMETNAVGPTALSGRTSMSHSNKHHSAFHLQPKSKQPLRQSPILVSPQSMPSLHGKTSSISRGTVMSPRLSGLMLGAPLLKPQQRSHLRINNVQLSNPHTMVL